MRELVREAGRLGVQIHAAHLDGDLLGFYSHHERRIYFDIRLTPMERVEVVAHELGHAYHGHSCDDDLSERQADRRAALLLVDPEAYRSAERENPHPRHIAESLGLSVHLVKVWRDWWLPQIRAHRIAPI